MHAAHKGHGARVTSQGHGAKGDRRKGPRTGVTGDRRPERGDVTIRGDCRFVLLLDRRPERVDVTIRGAVDLFS